MLLYELGIRRIITTQAAMDLCLEIDTFTGITVPCRAFSEAKGSFGSFLKHFQSSSYSSYSKCRLLLPQALPGMVASESPKTKKQQKIENTPGDARSGVV